MKKFKYLWLGFAVVGVLVVWLLFLVPKKAQSKAVPEVSVNTVFLTFDADMTPYMKKEQESGTVKKWYDPALITYLEKNNIHATFFVTGMFAEMYLDLMREIAVNPNFSIENHSYDHSVFEPNCYGLAFVKSDEEKRTEIEKTQNIIKSISGVVSTYFRYPGLCHNAHDDAIVAGEGLKLTKDEFGSGDAYMKDPKLIVKNILDNIKHVHVIVFHMGTKNTPATTAAVESVVPKLEKLGYVFGTL